MDSPLLYRDATNLPMVEIDDEPQAINDDSAPKTPPSNLPLDELRKLKATPHNRGTASAAEHLLGVRLDDVLMPVFDDVKSARPVGFEQMLLALLSLSQKDADPKPTPDSLGSTPEPSEITLEPFLKAVLPFCNALDEFTNEQGEEDIRNFRECLKTYCSAKTEKQRYEPLTLALNHALHWLDAHFEMEENPLVPVAKHNHLLFHVNDPKPITGRHFRGDWTQVHPSVRKPDIILTNLDAVQRLMGAETSWSDYALRSSSSNDPTATRTPAKGNFLWDDEAVSAEIKQKHVITSHQATSYDIAAPLVKIDPLNVIERYEGPVSATPSVSRMESPSLPSQHIPVSQHYSIHSRQPPCPNTRKETRSTGSELPSAFFPSRQASETLPKTSQSASSSGISSSLKRGATESAGSASKRVKLDNSSAADPPPKLTPAVQTAMYAAERLCHAEWISHAVNLLIIDEVVYVWWYDRQGIFQSYGLNFIQHLPHFLVLILALQRLQGSKSLGVIEEVYTHDTSSILSLPVKGGETLQLELDNYLRTYYGILGRGTWVRTARCSSADPRNPGTTLTGKGLVVKFSWPERQRTSEVDIIKAAEKIQSGYVRGHIPKLVYSDDIDTVLAPFRRHLGLCGGQGDRVLRVSVFEMLEPLTTLTGDDFWNAFWECFRCHLYLWKSGIQHRDISVSNLMYDPVEQKGVLIDFDLARLPGKDSPSGTERTGTIPFMALDLLTSAGAEGHIEHRYRHDCESFAWVLLWICCRYKDGKPLEDNKPFVAFEAADFHHCLAAKLDSANYNNVKATGSFHPLHVLFANASVKKWQSRYHAMELRKSEAGEHELDKQAQITVDSLANRTDGLESNSGGCELNHGGSNADTSEDEEPDVVFIEDYSERLKRYNIQICPSLQSVLGDFVVDHS